MHQQGLTVERLRAIPARCTEASRRITERRHAESGLIERPSRSEFSERQMQASQCKPGRRVIRVASQCAAEGRSRFAILSEQLENQTCVGEILGSRTTHGRGADETVERLRQLP